MTANAPDEPQHPDEECDIVMRGGVTSGVLYPSAVRCLARRYRFRGIGGSSVGAVAAAVTAAAEYGRRTGQGTGFAQLEVIDQELAQQGRLLSLFRPRPGVRSLHALGLAVVTGASWLRVAIRAAAAAPWVLLVLAAWWATLGVVSSPLSRGWPVLLALVGGWAVVALVVAWYLAREPTLAVVGLAVLAPLLWPLGLALPAVALAGWRDLTRNGFGLVPGASPDGDALCDWLHRHLQAAAGLDEDRPLTFGMLSSVDDAPYGIVLEMMTTNLSTARPVRLPRELTEYAFDPADLADKLPASVLRWLEQRGIREGDLIRLPAEDDIPVLLAFRLSLSFPLLFTAVRLHGHAPDSGHGARVPHWFSDGGIGSNFPIHFFDAWMPRRPTFALSFAPFPQDPAGRRLPDADEVGVPPGPNEPKHPRWVGISNTSAFFGQILDTMQNWRDTLQSELPGFRDRVYEARLDKARGEGGLNLGMDADTISELQRRGQRVGERIVDTFDLDQHLFTRYLVAMQQLELGLLGGGPPGGRRSRAGLRDAFAARRDDFAIGDVGAGELFDRGPPWLRSAGTATWALTEHAEGWAAFGGFLGDAPRPLPTMRVVPDV